MPHLDFLIGVDLSSVLNGALGDLLAAAILALLAYLARRRPTPRRRGRR